MQCNHHDHVTFARWDWGVRRKKLSWEWRHDKWESARAKVELSCCLLLHSTGPHSITHSVDCQVDSLFSISLSSLLHKMKKLQLNFTPMVMDMEIAPLLSWWDQINDSTRWQSAIFYFLCAAYALVSSIALVSIPHSFFKSLFSTTLFLIDCSCIQTPQIQLVRIDVRVPEYGWTTQKIFHLMNFLVNGGEWDHTPCGF